MNTDTATILLVEDNAADIMLVREALEQHKIDCILNVIKDGAEMIAFLDNLNDDSKLHALDLILLDMHLPKHDGEEILKKLRSTEDYAQTPVVVMTSSVSPHEPATADKLAALHYFNKPANFSDYMKLGILVGEILQQQKQSGRGQSVEPRGSAHA